MQASPRGQLLFSGSYGFTVSYAGGTGNDVVLTTTVVNRPPVATNDTFVVDEDSALNGDVLANDTDPDNDTLSVAVVTGPAHGTLSLNPNGSFSYAPAANYHGPDGFTYRANDGKLDSNLATVSITVTSVNDAPVATVDSCVVEEDGTLNVAAPGVLANDTDVDGR